MHAAAVHMCQLQAHNLQLHHGDVMQLDLQQLVQQAAQTAATQQLQQLDSNTNSRAASSQGKVKVVANLPYNITKDFLLALLPQGGIVSELSIMIQEEVAQRLVDPTPSRPDYRAMSVITHYYSKPVYRFRWAFRGFCCIDCSSQLPKWHVRDACSTQ